MPRAVVIGLIVLLAGAVGAAVPQAPSGQDGGQAIEPSHLGKKICGWPRPDDVPEEVWENACTACTSVPTSPEASADGTMTSHSCDGGYEIRIKVVPGRTYPAGAKRDIMKGGGLGEEKPLQFQERKVGEIPQVERTFTRYDASYPFMNEKGVVIGETTIGGRRELYSDEGLFDIMELERLALERASSAREAIRIMGEFAERYGYGDSGECLTVGDAAEVWQFEIFGPGAADIGAVWAAKRIPPGEVGVSANVSRITTLGDDPNFTMHSKNVYEVAEKNGWWKKGEPFVFNRAYGMSGSPRFNRREWRVLSLLAPSLKLDPWAPEQPFSVKPDRKVTKQDLIAIHRDIYEGTPFDRRRTPWPARSARPTAGPSRATTSRSKATCRPSA
ncbi:MAG TPA: C69 family dipeptidase [Vicinamibacterales bacterium]|nr:C69 family dipeptidase [Vicinamibacterales bacterium]